VNVITRRMQCFACGKLYNVTRPRRDCWHITHAEAGAVPFIVASSYPICIDPRCEAHKLADMNSERVTTDAGDVIVLDSCERPTLN